MSRLDRIQHLAKVAEDMHKKGYCFILYSFEDYHRAYHGHIPLRDDKHNKIMVKDSDGLWHETRPGITMSAAKKLIKSFSKRDVYSDNFILMYDVTFMPELEKALADRIPSENLYKWRDGLWNLT